MRITSASSYDLSVSNLQRRQSALSDAQTQLTSGKRVQRPSDDPAAAAQIERAMAAMTRSESQQRALDAAKTTMSLGESALGDANSILQQARELMVSAGNGTFSDNERKAVGENLRSLRNDLLAVANRSDGNGRYIFGGQGSDTAPLVDGPGGVSYTGTTGHMQAATTEAMPMSLDGRAVWLQAPDPANPGGTLSIFDALDRAVGDLLTPGRDGAQIAATASQGLASIDAASSNLSSWRSSAGEALNRADSVGSRLSQAKLDAQTARSNAEDLDMVSAISDFQIRQTGYDAALKTYSLVQRMTLFDYIK